MLGPRRDAEVDVPEVLAALAAEVLEAEPAHVPALPEVPVLAAREVEPTPRKPFFAKPSPLGIRPPNPDGPSINRFSEKVGHRRPVFLPKSA